MMEQMENSNQISREPEEQGESLVLFVSIIALLLLALVNGI
jgi:hypothetical protein